MDISFSTLLLESLYLTRKIWTLLCRYALDACIRPLVVDKDLLAKIFDDTVSFESVAPGSKGGAGGHGTERDWIVVSANEKKYPVFIKSATHNFSESFFLNLFDVYSNELRFYQFIKSMPIIKSFPSDFFPIVYSARFSCFSSNFLLMLENVDRTRVSMNTAVLFPELSSKSEHPLRRILAVLNTQATLHAEFFMRPPECVWKKGNRPPLLQIIAQSTLKDVEARFPEILSSDVAADYRLFLHHYHVIRRYWDSCRLTLVHGDAHLGNYFFEEEKKHSEIFDTRARMYDFQCTAQEHPVRDVVYHILCSVDENLVSEYGGDERFLRYYLDLFNEKLKLRECGPQETKPDSLGFVEAWKQYRLHSFWALAAFIISAGAGEKLFEADKASFLIKRIAAGCKRIQAGKELHTLLKLEGVI